jgi:prepilin-type processing-associated H-X9-DG protein
VPWPDGTRIVGFADGHAKKVNGDEWTKITKYLKLKLKKVAKPLPPGIADRIAK